MNNQSLEKIKYQTAEGDFSFDVQFDGNTVWLSQKDMAGLFGKSVKTINEHIVNVYQEEELEKHPTIRKFRIVQKEGNREVIREVEHYNLDVIISVGYRVKSKRGTQFRIWATKVLKDHLLGQKQVISQKEFAEIKNRVDKQSTQLEHHETYHMETYEMLRYLLAQIDPNTEFATKGTGHKTD